MNYVPYLTPYETLSNFVHVENDDNTQQQLNDSTNDPKITSFIDFENTTNVLVGSASSICHDEIILQSALADVCDIHEKRTENTCILFDGGSQRTYLTDELRDRLGLKCIRKEKLILKRFASNEGLWRCLDVVQICLKGKDGMDVYMEALCVPHICSPLKVPVVSWTKSQYKYLQHLELATPPTDVNKVEVLVG